MLRIHGHVGDAALRADVERPRPRLPTVGRTIDAAVGAVARDRPQRSDQHDVRILWIDQDARDVPRPVEAEMEPRLSAVGGLVDAVTVADVVARIGFAG